MNSLSKETGDAGKTCTEKTNGIEPRPNGEELNQRAKTMEYEQEIPKGQTREEIAQREKIIKDFYASWNAVNPTKHIFNIALQDFIHVRFLSIQETAEHAAFTYKSTLAVTYLTEILEKATVEKRVNPKPNNQNQKRFSEIIIMQYNKRTFGKIKLTVGVLRSSRQNIQYCITAIEKTTDNPPRPGNSYQPL